MTEKSEHISRLLKRQAFVRAASERYQVAVVTLGVAVFFLVLIARGLWMGGSSLYAAGLVVMAVACGFLAWRCWQGSVIAARVATDAQWLAAGKLEEKLPSFWAVVRGQGGG